MQNIAGFGVWNRDPLVIHTYWYTSDIISDIHRASEKWANKSAIYLISSGWSVIDRWRKGEFSNLSASLRRFALDRPSSQVIFLGNDLCETLFLRSLGLKSFQCSHNAFINFWRYPAQTDIESQEAPYHSLYVARIAPYKRVELMELLDNSALIAGSVDKDYFSRIKDKLVKVHFVNGVPDSENFRSLSHREVALQIRKTKVGLCLSSVEGAMLASAEYLLAGIPVVSTFALGGRDSLFTEENSTICNDDVKSINAAVQHRLANRVSPSFIYSQTVNHLMKLRVNLLDHLIERASSWPDQSIQSVLLDYNFEFRYHSAIEVTSVST